jgi:hypothetical protein
MRTYWFCERCDKKGSVQHDAHAGVWEVYQSISAAHEKKGRPLGCFGLQKVRVSLTKPKGSR